MNMKFIRHRIGGYKKLPQNFLAAINSMDHTYGNIHEPYEIYLTTFMFWGLIAFENTYKTNFPRGFNAQKELSKGREFIF